MTLDWQICSRARLSRDPRFDGKFFIGVMRQPRVLPFDLSGAYSQRRKLSLFPDSRGGGGSWLSTLPALPAGVFARNSRVAGNAKHGGARFAIDQPEWPDRRWSRSTRREAWSWLASSSAALPQAPGCDAQCCGADRRLHFAKKLIDETTLPMSEVSLASGFGCVRRFNENIRKTYHRTPTQIRALVRQSRVQPENQYVFRLRFRPPYNWKGMLAFLAARAVPGVEMVEGGSYRRSISLRGSQGYFAVSLEEASSSLVARVQFSDPSLLYLIVERIRAMFDLNADWSAIERTLRTEPELAKRVKREPGLRVPGCWDGFELATRAILGQQITVKGATVLAGRMVQTFGQKSSAVGKLTHIFPTPETLAEANLRMIGLTAARAETVRGLARAVSDGQIRFSGDVDADSFEARLCEIPGIGKWTAQYVAMRALGEPDAFPSGDLGLLHSLGLTSSRELYQRAEAWRPWRAYATIYFWYLASENKTTRNKTALPRPLKEPTPFPVRTALAG